MQKVGEHQWEKSVLWTQPRAYDYQLFCDCCRTQNIKHHIGKFHSRNLHEAWSDQVADAPGRVPRSEGLETVAAAPDIDSRARLSTFEPMATTLLRARVDTRHAVAAKKILAGLGLDTTTAVNMLFAQVVAQRGLPFAVQENGYAYAASEYGLTSAEMDAAAKRIRRGLARERKAGTIRPVRSADDLL